MKLYIDTETGECRRTLTGPKVGGLVFYLRDILDPLEIVFVEAGVPRTSTVLADSAVLAIGLKAAPNGTLLAAANTYTLVGETARVTFSLNTTALVSYFADNVPAGARESAMLFEVEVSAQDATTRETYLQETAQVRRDVNQANDLIPDDEAELYVLIGSLFDANGRAIAPQFVAHRGEITARTGGTATALDAIVTTNLSIPFAVLINIGGSGEVWQLAAGTDAEDGTFTVRPDDYHASTNARVWKRIL